LARSCLKGQIPSVLEGFFTSSVNGLEPYITPIRSYITVAKGRVWADKRVDHDITKLVCNIADTALPPREAAKETITIIRELVERVWMEADDSRFRKKNGVAGGKDRRSPGRGRMSEERNRNFGEMGGVTRKIRPKTSNSLVFRFLALPWSSSRPWGSHPSSPNQQGGHLSGQELKGHVATKRRVLAQEHPTHPTSVGCRQATLAVPGRGTGRRRCTGSTRRSAPRRFGGSSVAVRRDGQCRVEQAAYSGGRACTFPGRGFPRACTRTSDQVRRDGSPSRVPPPRAIRATPSPSEKGRRPVL